LPIKEIKTAGMDWAAAGQGEGLTPLEDYLRNKDVLTSAKNMV